MPDIEVVDADGTQRVVAPSAALQGSIDAFRARIKKLEALIAADLKAFETGVAHERSAHALAELERQIVRDADALRNAEAGLVKAEAAAKNAKTPAAKALAWEEALAFAHFSAPSDVNPVLEQWAVQAGLGNIAGAAWCAYFQMIAWFRVKGKLPAGVLAGEPGYVPWILAAAKAKQHGLHECAPLPGAWMCFDWNGDGIADHVGMVVDVAARKTVEGNTSSAYGAHTVAYHSGSQHWPFSIGCVWPWDMH